MNSALQHVFFASLFLLFLLFGGYAFLSGTYFYAAEARYNPASFTVTCPDDDPQTIPLPTVTINQIINNHP